jgi:hypothetical protein
MIRSELDNLKRGQPIVLQAEPKPNGSLTFLVLEGN